MKRWLAAVLIFVAVVALTVVAIPQFRLTLLGAGLSRDLQPGSADDVMFVSVISTGSEIRPLSEGPAGLLPQMAQPESYDLRMTLEETVDSPETLRYRVKEVRSEQMGTSGGEDLVGSVVLLRLLPGGLTAALAREKGPASEAVPDSMLAQALAAVWPAVPGGLLRPEGEWTGTWDVTVPAPLLEPGRLVLHHRLRYRMAEFHREGDRLMAPVQVTGEIVPRAEGEAPAGVTVTGTGRVDGTCVIDLATGKALIGNDRTAYSVAIRLQDQALEVVTFSDRQSRFWRPRIVADGARGFEPQAPGLPKAP